MNAKSSLTVLAAFYLATLFGGTAQAQFPGDVNLDQACDFLDVPVFLNLVATGTYLQQADLNVDGSVNFLDVPLFRDILAFGTGDIDRNGALQNADVPGFIAVLASGGYDPLADMNGDFSVDSLDIPLFIIALRTGISTH